MRQTERTKGTKKRVAERVNFAWTSICWLGIAWFVECWAKQQSARQNTTKHACTHMGCMGMLWFLRKRENRDKRSNCKERKDMRSKEETKGERRARRLRQQRKAIQKRIRNWYKARKLKYNGKDRRRYRSKVRASKRLLHRSARKEAEEAIEENGRGAQGGRRTRKGGGREVRGREGQRE
eukprot:6185843-Pleurochrysis_carterae.AAC.1